MNYAVKAVMELAAERDALAAKVMEQNDIIGRLSSEPASRETSSAYLLGYEAGRSEPASTGLDEPTLTRVLGEIALVVGGDLLTGGVKHRVALAAAILARLSESASSAPQDDPKGQTKETRGNA